MILNWDPAKTMKVEIPLMDQIKEAAKLEKVHKVHVEAIKLLNLHSEDKSLSTKQR